jgi:hypothetical protein
MITERNMTFTRRAVSLLRTLTILTLAVPVLNSTAMAQNDLQQNTKGYSAPIEGSWIFNVDAGPVTFTALASFSAGGVFFGTGSLDRVNPVSTLTGSWKRTGPNRFDSTAYFLSFDAAGNAVGMLKTNQAFHLKGCNELVGAAFVYSCNLLGEDCVSVSPVPSKVTGKRMVIEKISE